MSRDDHFQDDENVTCEGCGDQIHLVQACLDEEGVWLCPDCYDACVEEKLAVRDWFLVECVIWFLTLLGLIAVLTVAIIRTVDKTDQPQPRLGYHAVIRAMPSDQEDLMDTPGATAAAYYAQHNADRRVK